MSEVTWSKFVTHFFNSKVKIKHFPFFYLCISPESVTWAETAQIPAFSFLCSHLTLCFVSLFCNNYEYLINHWYFLVL